MMLRFEALELVSLLLTHAANNPKRSALFLQGQLVDHRTLDAHAILQALRVSHLIHFH